MRIPAALCPALLSAVAPACLFFAACDPVDDPQAKPRHWQPPPEPPRRAVNADPANARWLAAWRELRKQLAPLEARLAELQKIHTESQFDGFLTLDVDSLGVEQLSSLYHFLQRGYFTVERRVLIHLLERRLDRTDSSLAIPSGLGRPLKDNLATAMHRDEIRMVDLETAIRFYEETGDANFQVPTVLTEEETAELRDVVSGMLDKARSEIEAMDKKIAALKAEAFPGSVTPVEEQSSPSAVPAEGDAPASPPEPDGPVDTAPATATETTVPAPEMPMTNPGTPLLPDAEIPDAETPDPEAEPAAPDEEAEAPGE
jgi:hypothetical protein